MISNVLDWKEVAGKYYEKAVTLSILILLFAFLVSPQIEVKPFERTGNTFIGLDLPQDIEDPVPPPETIVKPDIKLIFEDGFSEDDPDVILMDTLEPTTLDPFVIITGNIEGSTKIYQVYEDPPVLIKQITPQYTDLARNIGMEGVVELEVEVFSDGTVGAVNVLHSLLSGPGGLDNEAINAVKQWEYQPARSSGRPVAVWITFPVEFRLE
jgi:TonB family protein